MDYVFSASNQALRAAGKLVQVTSKTNFADTNVLGRSSKQLL